MKKIFLFLAIALSLSLTVESKGVVVSILGDSYSTFEGCVQPDTNLVWYHAEPRPSTDVTAPGQTWWGLLTAGDSPYEIEVNNSYSGSTICHTGYRGEDYSDRSFVTRMNNLGSPDIILVFGATNDSWAGAPIGEYVYSDWTADDLYSFRPALACLLDGLCSGHPDAKIYFILNTDLKPEINESVATICPRYGVDIITLSDIDKMSGHPSIKGMEAIARQVATGLRQ